MRSWLLALAVAVTACGSSSKPPVDPGGKTPAADPNVIDVKALPPLTVGFHYDAAIHQHGTMSSAPSDQTKTGSSESSGIDIEYSLALLELNGDTAEKVRLDVRTYSKSADGVDQPAKVAGQSYVLSATAATHADGSAAGPDEVAEIAELAQSGVFALPVRDALVGLRLEKGKPVSLTAEQLLALIFQSPLDGGLAKSDLTFTELDASGVATLTVTMKSESADKTATTAVDAVIKLMPATVLPLSLEITKSGFVYAPNGDTLYISGNQTLTWTFSYPS